jgi:hypothetical protein
MAASDTTNSKLSSYRVGSFQALGFSEEDAAKLAEATMTVEVKTKNGVRTYEKPLSWHRAQKLLDKGCPLDLAVKILL